jgi:hypothetical protein
MPTTEISGIKERILGLLKVILEDSDMIPKMYQGVIMGFVKPKLDAIPESDLYHHIQRLRDEIIPFILGDVNASDKN